MKKFIVTTTINSPTKATLKFCKIAQEKNWIFIIVGDTKTPHDEYKLLENSNVIYLDPNQQELLYPELSKTIGWKSIQRRNIGFVFAYNQGADIVATVDDDNIPYDNWGDNVFVNQMIEIDTFSHNQYNVFDPISATSHNNLWHRGYPIEFVPDKNNIEYKGKTYREVLIQADFWDGDPDIDALCRLSKKPIVKFEEFKPFGSNQIAPFNSQNTFLARKVLPYYAVLPHVGRMDDIWGAYIVQHYFPNSVIYNKATVYQDRNVQDLITNLQNEVIGYRSTLNLINDLENYYNHLPKETQDFWDIYKKQF
jgi:acetyltransferase-like isoleucine patch superfamily enzyme